MDARRGPGSRGSGPRTSHLLILSVTLALVGASCGDSPSSSASPTTRPPASPTITTSTPPSPGASLPATPVPSDGDWAAVDLPPLAATASLQPTKGTDDGIVAADTAFRLTSLDGTPVDEMARRLDIEPTLRLRVGQTDGDSVIVRPVDRLRAGQPYRFTLRRVDGSIARAWTVTAARALRVVGTIPGDGTDNVPTNTGIEVTFDQAGVTAAAVKDHFAISPKATGRFEVHGRVVAFVPGQPLKPLTLYAVTISKGLPLAGTGQTLQADVTFRFETRGKAATVDRLRLSDRSIDSAVRDAPVALLWFTDNNDDEKTKIPATIPTTVHRLPSLRAAMDADTLLATTPDWARSAGAPVSTTDLPRVLRADLRTHRIKGEEGEDTGTVWIRLPEPLPRGWYVMTLTHGGLREQMLLQVSDLAAYAMVTTTRTVVWVNSVRSGDPVSGAALSVAGTSLGRTNAEGLRVVGTPAAVSSAIARGGPAYLTVRDGDGRATFVSVWASEACGKCDTGSGVAGTTADIDDWWSVLSMDRLILRSTDQANIWGVVRARDGGAVPATVEIRLESYDQWMPTDLPILVKRVKPAATGMFTAELAFTDLPVGDYNVALRVDGADLADTYVRVEPIVKPAYQLELTVRDRAVLSGATVRTDISAAFYEGTPVAGVDLLVSAERFGEDEDEGGDEGARGVPARTGPDGAATAQVTVTLPSADDDDDDWGQWGWEYVGTRPALPEEADIGTQTWVAVFRSTALLKTQARISDGKMIVTGDLHDVDFARMAAADPQDWDADPTGGPRAGARVRLRFTESIPVRTQIGTSYDPITKTTAPVYQYRDREVALGSRTVTTRADGTFRTTLDVRGGNRWYEVRARYVDEGERPITARGWAIEGTWPSADDEPQLVVPGAADDGSETYAIGDTVRVRMQGGRPDADADRYLFTVASRGLRTATIQPGGTFSTTFRAAWVPDANIRGIRFNGGRYDVTSYGYWAAFRTEDRSLDVRLSTDAARYAPGGTVRLTVRTLDAAGRPVPATVVLRAVDEKLYAIGAASDVSLLNELYRWVGDGTIATNWSHRPPSPGSEGGDTTGGGGDDERSDFRDWVLFRQVTTNAEGRASVSFALSDDLTSWRVAASAITAKLQAGDATTKIPVGLPFFAEAALAAEYLVGDEPILRVRAFGSALEADDTVSFTVTGSSLGMTATTVTAAAFQPASVTIPTLPSGTHQIRIVATTGSGASRLRDVLIRSITVVESRTARAETWTGPLTARMDVRGGGTGFTTLVLSDGGRGRVLPILQALISPNTVRGDQALAAVIADEVLRGGFDAPDAWFEAGAVDLAAFQQPGGGFALLPYASPDVELSALAAMVAHPGIDRGGLTRYLQWLREETEETAERQFIALVGLAALDQPVLPDIRLAATDTTLPPTLRAWLALGALVAGDEALAADLERALLRADGERLGPWVRVALSDDETTAATTALLAIVAAGIGDPLAADMDAYLESHPPKDTVLDLQRALAARWWAERTPGSDAAASLAVDGSTRRVDIKAGEAVWLQLTPKQVDSAVLTPVRGTVVVTSGWEGPLDPSSLRKEGVSTFTRTVRPSRTIGLGDVVIVEYHVDFGQDATAGASWLVTDLVPSGLAPIAGSPGWWDEDEGTVGAITPWRIVGQRVDFEISSLDASRTLRYVARVVTPGKYRWEPAVIQSSVVPEWGTVVPATEVTISAK